MQKVLKDLEDPKMQKDIISQAVADIECEFGLAEALSSTAEPISQLWSRPRRSSRSEMEVCEPVLRILAVLIFSLGADEAFEKVSESQLANAKLLSCALFSHSVTCGSNFCLRFVL